MLKGNIKRYKIDDQNVKDNPSEYIMMECCYCGEKFHVGMNILHWINQGYYTHCNSATCRRKHEARQRAKWQDSRSSRKIIKSPRQQRVMKEITDSEAKILKKRRLEDDRFKEQSKNWYFGPGDIFYDVIVGSILDERMNTEKAS